MTLKFIGVVKSEVKINKQINLQVQGVQTKHLVNLISKREKSIQAVID